MTANEIRKDYLLNRLVVIAKDRKKRPLDFVHDNNAETNNGVCPLCLGNEHITPPAVLVYVFSEGKINKLQDTNEFIHKDWILRVIPNLYPVVDYPKNAEQYECSGSSNATVGHHEVIVESPCHNENPSTARLSQLVHVINSYIDRINALSKKPYVQHVAIFRNYGPESGASLLHPHSQIVTTPFIPPIMQEELTASKNYWNKNNECYFCNLLKNEINGPRFIWENHSFVVLSPWASTHSFEFWVIPKRHNSNMANMSSYEVNDLAKTLRICFGGLGSLLNNPSYNFGFHTLLSEDAKDCYHWHLEVYPRLGKWGGLEKSTGVFINPISPEEASKELKTVFEYENKSLM
ncbi:MAG: DUF4921 family protein [Candidatus Bathyarchaeota archaeon]|nr:MAG: DUF4921 family protein [Candidatus Bathyarchaeum tardum]WNZ28992.1 MAG: DUF4921 family protein [Candidatus Bathyarchaeota archaeon]